MAIYEGEDYGTEFKGPADPVTRADREANELLVAAIRREFGDVPIVAEESDPSTFGAQAVEPCAFFVDPIDGTREFVRQNGEFSIMLGYAEEGRSVVGVVLWPSCQKMYCAIVGEGAFVETPGGALPLAVSEVHEMEQATCAVSRSRRSEALSARLDALACKELVSVGSAGIKAALVASAVHDIYVHPSPGPVQLWDAAAPDAIVQAAGGVFTDSEGLPFDYRGALLQGQGILAANPVLHAEARRRLQRHRGVDS